MKIYPLLKDTVLDDFDKKSAYMQAALLSDNPTVVDHIEKLMLLISITDPKAVATNIETATMLTYIKTRSKVSSHDREKIHKIVDDILDNIRGASFVALENLFDVAQREFKKSR